LRIAERGNFRIAQHRVAAERVVKAFTERRCRERADGAGQ